jgi:hypothetical protein
MRTVRLSVCFLFLVGMLIGGPANADSIVAVAVPTVTFTGNSVCGASQNMVCVESFNASFQWDNTTNSVVPGTAQIMPTGPLGSFSFLESLVNSFGPGGGQLLIAIWTNSAGDELTADINTPLTRLVPGSYPIVGPSQPGDAGAGLGCNEVPLDTGCEAYFLIPRSGQEFAPNPMVVTGVPEGSTSFMLLLGLLLLVLWRFRVNQLARLNAGRI